MAMHSLTFRLAGHDKKHLDALVTEMQESTPCEVTASDALRMLLRDDSRRRQRYGPHLLCDVVCKRDARGIAIVTGVRHDLVDLSPTGFEWGYLGAGPSDLALNILMHATGERDFAYRHCRQFRDEVVAWIPHAGGTLSAAKILAWVEARQNEDRVADALLCQEPRSAD